MQGGDSVFVLNVDPGPELILKGRVLLIVSEVFASEGLEMQNVYFEFREFIFEGGVVKEGRPIFLFHEGEIELGTLLKVVSQVFVALDVHDGLDGSRVYGLLLGHLWFRVIN